MDQLTKKTQSLSKTQLDKYLTKIPLSKLHPFKLYLDDLYYNTGDSIMDDWRYDMIKDILNKRDPDYTPPVGAKIRSGENRVRIPYWMGSADKITPTEPDKYQRWVLKNPAKTYVLSDKLDGVSGLFVSKNGVRKLYTRGDGEIGADISYLIQYFNIPNVKEDVVVRGELIMKKTDFLPFHRKAGAERSVLKSGGKDYRNARNMVSGLIGAKTLRHGTDKIHFVAYELVGDHMPKPSSSFEKLVKMGFEVVWNTVSKISLKKLSDTFADRRENGEYDIDGIIVQSNVSYDRNHDGNPSYMFAFKEALDENIHTTTVKHIEWNVSKWGQLKPVAVLDPVLLPDITIRRATAHNAGYVEENRIGPGTVIKVTRSKDVIPYIVDIVTQSKEPQMPTVPYLWDDNHVNIRVKKVDDIMCIKLIAGMFAKLGIKQVSQQTVKKMFDAGFNNLMKILGATKKQLATVDGFQERSAERTYNNIHNGLKNVKLAIVLGASGIFGFGIGRKRIELLMSDIPDLLTIYKTMSKAKLKKKILEVEGFSDIMADKVVANVKHASLFARKMEKYATFKVEERVSDLLKGMKIVMTGFRDKKLEEDIVSRGGKTVGSVSKNTSILVVKSKGSALTGKSKKAHDLGIPILQKEEFVAKYIV